MMCDECGLQPATIRLTTIIGGNKTERNLCPGCMARMQKSLPRMDVTALTGLLSGFLHPAKPDAEPEGPMPDLTCEGCAMTYREFRKTGRLGCAHCYEAFREPLLRSLDRAHGHTQHIGRVPDGPDTSLALQLKIERFQQELITAIAAEEYEHAARLRDEIRSLKSQLEASGKEENAHE